jgi:hypothetical protein
MSIKLFIQQGQEGNAVAELTDSLPVIEGTNTPLVKMGMHYGDGDSGQSTFTLMERTGSELAVGHRPSGRRLTTLIEDVTGCERWIHRGRINSGVFGMGARPGGNNAELENTSFDGNMELRGQAFTEDWVRPAETDYERLVALQAYILNGPDSTSPVPAGDTHGSRASCRVVVDDSHLCKNANTVTMPAATYPIGTQPIDVVSDCATTAGKDFSVVIHDGPFISPLPTTLYEEWLWNSNDQDVGGGLFRADLTPVHIGSAGFVPQNGGFDTTWGSGIHGSGGGQGGSLGYSDLNHDGGSATIACTAGHQYT